MATHSSPRSGRSAVPANASLPNTRELQAVVERECLAFEEVIGMLKREQDQLVAASPDGLDAIVAAKNAGLVEIELVRGQRLALLERMGAPKESGKIERFIGAYPDLQRAWLRLRTFVREAQRLNTLNGNLVTMRLQFVNGRLDALRQAAGLERGYHADGSASGTNRSGRVIAAA